MSGKPRSLRQAQLALAGQLRAQGRSWAEIAAEFRAVYRVNARVDDPKTFKNFSYWELWPSGTGHAPSLDTLDRLAQLYECSISDLLADCRDYGARSPRPLRVVAGRGIGERGPRSRQAAEHAGVRALSARGGCGPPVPSPALHAALEKIREAEIGELAHGDAGGNEAGLRLKRRTLLLEASSALAVVAAAPLL